MDLRYTFNEDVCLYDQMRPTYPKELFTSIFEYAHLNQCDKAIELGIGTGQATLPFLKAGLDITAIELGANLANYSIDKFQCYPNLKVIQADFMDIALPKGTFQLFYSATAFHWLDASIAFPKVKECLKAGGTIALFWNHPYVNRSDDLTHQKIRAIYTKYKPNDPRDLSEFDGHTCQAYCDDIKKQGFINVTSQLFHRTRQLTAQDYIGLLNTYSDHRTLEKNIKTALETEIYQAILEANNTIFIYDTIDLYLATNKD